ncbi:LOW QUALITY PROTEIN: uncharacterized protein LOC114730567 [Neltuma alba]|uniref:LOW QUALITY PROTEIN: uncharacterized protein LOC114730567 n=1 Tax=Neltuma alba TaxID=207710 RepID=UPI0010A4982F|nr:LOW QUALITY PROTEIN: uncharacterized protein LOC114730567 [Prosopis alba]
MEDMEIDQIVDVPDTPERLTNRHFGRKYAGNPDVCVNEKGERAPPVAENSKNGRLAFCLSKSSNSGEMNNCIAASPSNNSCASQNAPIFRRSQADKSFSKEFAYTAGSEKMEKGKNICLKFPSNSSSGGDGGVTVFDLTEENGQPQKLKPFFSRQGLNDNATETKKDGKANTGKSPISCIPDSSNISSNVLRGKCKIDDKTNPCSNVTVDRGKSIDLSSDSHQKTEKQVSLSPRLITAPRFRGQKRLVRNGCISPYNIAARAKQSAEQNDVEQGHVVDDVSGNTTSHASINDIVAEERSSNRVKGKGLFIHPSSVHDARTINTASSSPMDNHEEASGTSNAIRNSHESFGDQGLTMTRNCRTTHWPLHDVTGHRSRRGVDSERFITTQCRNRVGRRETGSSQNTMDRYPLENHATSLIIPDAEQSTRPCNTADKLTKRQRKNASSSRNLNPEIMILDSPGESSTISSPQSPEVVEVLPGSTHINRASHDSDDMNPIDSDTRARQVEADEILARELQEQLYHEDSFDGGEDIDEHFAWTLQHEEELLHTSLESHHISHPRWLSRATSNRQPRSRSHQSPSNRRRAVPHVPPSSRVSQLRSRILNRSSVPATATRGRRLRFPVDMDFDMRLDILEALEDAVGDISDMGIAEDIFQAHRDFNENDYEMLLALDENNHQHAGASVHQINSLPQSTIQTDNFQESCAICLEIPVTGEVIRHLPCLHKFHKDCIDPWLRRRTSCPVCKSSII